MRDSLHMASVSSSSASSSTASLKSLPLTMKSNGELYYDHSTADSKSKISKISKPIKDKLITPIKVKRPNVQNSRMYNAYLNESEDPEELTAVLSENKELRLQKLLSRMDKIFDTLHKMMGSVIAVNATNRLSQKIPQSVDESQQESNSTNREDRKSFQTTTNDALSPCYNNDVGNPNTSSTSNSSSKGLDTDVSTREPKNILQPALLTGGKLRDYQLGGVEWMLSLFVNGLNGILAE